MKRSIPNFDDAVAGHPMHIRVYVPGSDHGAVEYHLDNFGLRLGVTERHLIGTLDATKWAKAGAYILLDRQTPDGRYRAYVGKAPAGLKQRLLTQERSRNHWARVLMITRDTIHGFSSADVGWLEGRLIDLLTHAQNASLYNGNRTIDLTISASERQGLETTLDPIRRVLRIVGYDTSASAALAAPVPRAAGTRVPTIPLPTLVEAGVLQVGDRLAPGWPKYRMGHQGLIVRGGLLEVNGQVFKEPSPAAKLVRAGKNSNGYDFWDLLRADGARVRLRLLRDAYLERLATRN